MNTRMSRQLLNHKIPEMLREPDPYLGIKVQISLSVASILTFDKSAGGKHHQSDCYVSLSFHPDGF